MPDSGPNVAIACQGGGSHTAFTAGVLDRLLAAEGDHEIVGFSGTSGGSICALLAWYGRLHDDHDPGTLLESFWTDIGATAPFDRGVNMGMRTATQLRMAGVPLPELSPFWNPSANWGQRHLRELLEAHVDFETVAALADSADLGLLISAIDVLSGEFEIFREADITPDAILASAADPHLFNPVEIDGKTYWDGLFSKNPPIQDFNVADDLPDPDEIWVVKINPQERERVPRSLNGIMDRRNELSGNLSLNAEMRFIEQVNRWIDHGYLPDRYTHTEVRRIRFGRELDWTTKIDRRPEFLQGLLDDGRERADAFLDAHPTVGG
jgi:NTE family protein